MTEPVTAPRVELQGGRVYIRAVDEADGDAFFHYLIDNRRFLEPWEPTRPREHFTRGGYEGVIRAALADARADRAYRFGIYENESAALVGQLSLSNVSRGAWQNATLGYSVGRDHTNKGFATDGVKLALRFAFDHARLHRVQAGALPRNTASIKVLEKAGFRHEGESVRYLKINGVWEDHVMYAITVEEWPR